MKRIIFRVDDRLIHGQVVEGWLKNYRIERVAIVNDSVAADPMQRLIYESVVPQNTELKFYTLEQFSQHWQAIVNNPRQLFVLFSSINDLYESRQLISGDVYINIGCIASRAHCIALSDTVFLEPDEFEALGGLAQEWEIHIKKVPWENEVGFYKKSD